MKTKNEINVPLLRKIQKAIMASPGQLYMGDWFVSEPDYIPKCGTAACIAGWAITLSMGVSPLEAKVRWESEHYQGPTPEELLGLTDEQAYALFYASHWPAPFLEDYNEAGKSAKHNAKVTCARIEHFIKTKGAE